MFYNSIHYYYINLDNRLDRKSHIVNQFDNFNIAQYTRIPAIPHSCGHIGCSKSHILALETFISSNNNIGIIIEDDFEFTISPEQYRDLLVKLCNLSIDWNVILLSGNIKQKEVYNNFLDVCIEAQTTSGYMVNKKFAQVLLNNFREGLSLYSSSKGCQSLHTIDQYWKKLQGKGYAWYIFHPKCGRQMRSFSDIEGREIFYNC